MGELLKFESGSIMTRNYLASDSLIKIILWENCRVLLYESLYGNTYHLFPELRCTPFTIYLSKFFDKQNMHSWFFMLSYYLQITYCWDNTFRNVKISSETFLSRPQNKQLLWFDTKKHEIIYLSHYFCLFILSLFQILDFLFVLVHSFHFHDFLLIIKFNFLMLLCY